MDVLFPPIGPNFSLPFPPPPPPHAALLCREATSPATSRGASLPPTPPPPALIPPPTQQPANGSRHRSAATQAAPAPPAPAPRAPAQLALTLESLFGLPYRHRLQCLSGGGAGAEKIREARTSQVGGWGEAM